MPPYYVGSSPHTRGPPCKETGRDFIGRIIPAYAGSTSIFAGTLRKPKDHPRIRGVHPGQVQRPGGAEGSSPHTRGPHQDHGGQFVPFGIIPAYAGSTRLSVFSHPAAKDHPRIRGVHPFPPPARYRRLGSSPHTRGPRTKRERHHYRGRIIPAYAGSTEQYFTDYLLN